MFSFIQDNAITNLNKIIINPGILFFEFDLAVIFKLFSIKYLKQLGISNFCYIEDKSLIIKADHIYYIINNNTETCRSICKYIENNKCSIHHIIFISQANITCQRIFEYCGMWQYIKIHQLNVDAIFIEDSFLLVQDEFQFLITLQNNLGLFSVIQGIGINARIITKNLINYQQINNITAKIGRLIVIDRECDPVTPLLSQTSYAGILDDIYGFDRDIITIKSNYSKESCAAIPSNNLTHKKYILNNDDIFYKIIKDKPIESVIKIIIKNIKEYNEFKINKNNGMVNEKLLELAKNFIPKDYFDKHFNIVENVAKIIKTEKYQLYLNMEQQIMLEDIKDINIIMLYQPACSLTEILRLLCLFCLVNDGITTKELQLIRRMIILQYREVFIVDNLLEKGLLFIKNGRSWNKIVENFVLFPDNYIPLLYRLVENALISNYDKIWNRKKNILYRGFCDLKIDKKMSLISDDVFTVSQQNITSNDVVLVYIIGGITYDEIAALRTLNKEIIIASNKIINNLTMIDSCKNGTHIPI